MGSKEHRMSCYYYLWLVWTSSWDKKLKWYPRWVGCGSLCYDIAMDILENPSAWEFDSKKVYCTENKWWEDLRNKF